MKNYTAPLHMSSWSTQGQPLKIPNHRTVIGYVENWWKVLRVFKLSKNGVVTVDTAYPNIKSYASCTTEYIYVFHVIPRKQAALV
jgi:hypothetical protein